MLVLAAAWSVLIAASFAIGTAALCFIDVRRISKPGDRALLALWLGSIVIGVALTAASLVVPVGSALSIGVVLVLVGAALLVRGARASIMETARSVKRWRLIGAGVLTLGIAFYCSSQQVSFSDSGLYHAGAIEWLARYGAVKGVAFLEYRFGFASSWFSVAAALDSGPLAGRMTTVTGGFTLLLATAHFVFSLARIGRREGQVTDWFAVIAYAGAVTWVLRTGIAISPSPDLPVIVLVAVVTWTMLLLSSEDGDLPADPSLLPPHVVPVLLAAGALSIKLSAAPLLVIAFLFYVFYVWRVKPRLQLLVVSAIAAVMVLPTILVTLTVSGCPLFPSPIFCVDQPWSLGSLAAAHDQIEARDFLRWTGSVPSDANALNWLPHWVRSEPLGVLAIAYALVAIAGLVALRQVHGLNAASWVVLIGLGGILYVLGLSPTYRFLLAYAVVPPAYFGAWLCMRWRAHPIVLLPPMLVALASIETVTLTDYHSNGLTLSARLYSLILAVGALSLGVTIWLRADDTGTTRWMDAPITATLLGLMIGTSSLGLIPSQRPLPHPASGSEYAGALLSPPPLPTVKLQQHRLDAFEYASPAESQLCWATIPCSAEHVPINLHLLNPSRGVAGGFGT